jgi:hypothetical protein
VPVVQIPVLLFAHKLNNVAHAQHQLVLDQRHPRVVVQLDDRPRAKKVELADLGREDGEAVALKMKLAKVDQLSNLWREVDQLIAAEGEDAKVDQVAQIGGKDLKVVVAEEMR